MENGMEKTAMEKFMHGWRNNFAVIFAFVVLCAGTAFLLSGCVSAKKVPYEVFGDMEIDSANALEKIFVEFCFENHSEKAVRSFTIVLFAFDQDGSSPFYGRNNVVVKIEEFVPAGKSFFGKIPLDDFVYNVPEEPFELEYIYVSLIEYEDGSCWSDAFGMDGLNG